MAKEEKKATKGKAKEVRKRAEVAAPTEPEAVSTKVFPAETKINEYGFIGLSVDILAALGFAKTRKDKEGTVVAKGADHKIEITSVDYETKIITIKVPDIQKPEENPSQ